MTREVKTPCENRISQRRGKPATGAPKVHLERIITLAPRSGVSKRYKAASANARALTFFECFNSKKNALSKCRKTRKSRWILNACWALSKKLTYHSVDTLQRTQVRALLRFIAVRHSAKLSHLKKMVTHIHACVKGSIVTHFRTMWRKPRIRSYRTTWREIHG